MKFNLVHQTIFPSERVGSGDKTSERVGSGDKTSERVGSGDKTSERVGSGDKTRQYTTKQKAGEEPG